MEIIDKIVDFSYCRQCEHQALLPSEDPCHDCLNNPSNTHSRRPIHYKKKEEKKKKENKNKK